MSKMRIELGNMPPTPMPTQGPKKAAVSTSGEGKVPQQQEQRVSKLISDWKSANRTPTSTDQREQSKIKLFTECLDELSKMSSENGSPKSEKQTEMEKQVQGALAAFKAFEGTPKFTIPTMLTIALNHVDNLPPNITELADPDLCANRYQPGPASGE